MPSDPLDPTGDVDTGGLAGPGSDQPELHVLRGFELRYVGAPVQLPQTSQRVLAFLAVHERQLHRPYVAGSLWPDVSDDRADGSLRSALWRMRGLEPQVVESTGDGVRLNPAVRIDLTCLVRDARELRDRSADDLSVLAHGFEDELLPDWYDDWLIEWRERWRQIRFHALEEVARILVGEERCGQAVEVALAAVRAEPLRESAHRVVIEAHLAEGNYGEAMRHFRAYERLVHAELGIEPTPRIIGLVRDVIGRVTTQ